MAELSDCVAYYKFEDNPNDGSGNGRDFTLYGSPTYAAGGVGQGLDLESGSSQYAKSTASAFRFSGDKSISFWIKPETVDAGARLLHCYSAIAAEKYCVVIADTDKISADFAGTGKHGDTQLSAGNAYNVVVTWTSATSTVAIYVNNNPESLSSQTLNYDASTGLYVSKRGTGGTNYYDGIIDNLAVWNRVLSAAEITVLNGATRRRFCRKGFRSTTNTRLSVTRAYRSPTFSTFARARAYRCLTLSTCGRLPVYRSSTFSIFATCGDFCFAMSSGCFCA